MHFDQNSAPTVRPRHLPSPLIRARAIVQDRLNCLDLNSRARQALHAILAYANAKNPQQPVWAYRQSLTEEAMLGSVQTLYRALHELEARGYIKREQKRLRSQERYGQFAYSYIWLTEKALRMLQLASPEPAQPRPSVQTEKLASAPGLQAPVGTYQQRPSIKVRDGIQSNELAIDSQLSSKEQPVKASAGLSAEGVGSVETKIDKQTRLPTELTELLSFGLSKQLIAYLMRFARENGKQGMLGAVWEIARSRIEQLGLRGKPVMRYLVTMLKKPTDYGYIVKQRRDEQSAQSQSAALQTHLELKQQELVGSAYRTADGRHIIVEQFGRLRIVFNGVVRYGRLDTLFLDALAGGRLKPCVTEGGSA